jgi:hypothetical protein
MCIDRGFVRQRSRALAMLCAALWLTWPIAVPAQSDVRIYPAGCFDAHGRPLRADPSNPANSADPACQPPDAGSVIQGGRSAAPPPAGVPTMQRGSINLPPTPVPVPAGIGVMNP